MNLIGSDRSDVARLGSGETESLKRLPDPCAPAQGHETDNKTGRESS
jgi:hypothetical protein